MKSELELQSRIKRKMSQLPTIEKSSILIESLMNPTPSSMNGSFNFDFDKIEMKNLDYLKKKYASKFKLNLNLNSDLGQNEDLN